MFRVQGRIGFPEIEVHDVTETPTTELFSGVSLVNFGNSPIGVPITRTFEIRNTYVQSCIDGLNENLPR